MAFWQKDRPTTAWRDGQALVLEEAKTPPPPPAPPSREINEIFGETEQSRRNQEDHATYMLGYRHGLAMAKLNQSETGSPES